MLFQLSKYVWHLHFEHTPLVSFRFLSNINYLLSNGYLLHLFILHSFARFHVLFFAFIFQFHSFTAHCSGVDDIFRLRNRTETFFSLIVAFE